MKLTGDFISNCLTFFIGVLAAVGLTVVVLYFIGLLGAYMLANW